MNTTEKNTLIANFMGLTAPFELPQFGSLRPNGDFKTEFTAEQLKYHKNWAWLMEVVEKIETLSYVKGRHFYLLKSSAYVQIKVDRMNVDPFSKWGTFANTHTIIATYRAVVQFIEWYNQKSK